MAGTRMAKSAEPHLNKIVARHRLFRGMEKHRDVRARESATWTSTAPPLKGSTVPKQLLGATVLSMSFRSQNGKSILNQDADFVEVDALLSKVRQDHLCILKAR